MSIRWPIIATTKTKTTITPKADRCDPKSAPLQSNVIVVVECEDRGFKCESCYHRRR